MPKPWAAGRRARQLARLREAGVRVYTPASPPATGRDTGPAQSTPPPPLPEQDPTAALSDYELSHLGEHLESAGDGRSLERILRLEWGEQLPEREQRIIAEQPTPGLLGRLFRWHSSVPGRRSPAARIRPHPAWFEAKNRINRPDDFVEDVQRAWRLAATADAAELASHQRAPGLGLGARYALILTSVNSYASSVPTALLAALVRGGRWTAPQAVTYARRVPDTEERQKLLTALLPLLPEPLRSEVAVDAFDSARQLRAEGGSRKVISTMAPALEIPDELAACLPAAQVRQALGEIAKDRGPLLRRLAELGHLDEAVRLAGDDQADRSVLVAFMPEDEVRRRLADPGPDPVNPGDLYLRLAVFGDADQAIAYARTLEFPGPRKDMFLGIASHLTPATAGPAEAAAAELLRPDDMVLFLAAAARSAPQPDQARLLDDALALLPGIGEWGRDDLTARLIPQLDERQLDVVAELLRATQGDKKDENSYPRLMALFALARVSAGERRDWALRSALASSPRDARELLGRLLPAGWPAVDPAAALQASIDAGCTVRAMKELAPHLPADLITRVLPQVTQLNTAQWQWQRFGQRLADALAEIEPAAGLRRLADLSNPVERALGLIELAGTLPAAQLETALDIACAIPAGDNRVPALEALAPYLPERLLMRALDACHGEYERLWAQALETFAPYLPASQLRATVAQASGLKDGVWRAWAYHGVAAHLPLPELREVERLVRTLPEEASFRANLVLAKLAEGFARRGEHQHAVEVLRGIDRVSVPSPAVDAVIAMADSLPADTLSAAFDVLGDERAKPSLASAASRLPAPHRREWLETVLRETAGQASAEELALLSACFGEPPADAVLALAERARTPDAIPVLASVLPDGLVGRAAALARSTPDRDATERTRAFVALADRAQPEAAESLLEEALISALSIASYRHIGTDSGHKSELWRELRRRLSSLPAARRYSLSVRMLTSLSQHDRGQSLDGLGELLPLIGKLGGQAALAEAEAAASDVARWWP
jgi:hypothetical protein